MPDLTGIKAEEQDRYFLELGETERRITKINGRYIYEEKSKGNGLTAKKNVREISMIEFDELKKRAIKRLKRKAYVLSKNPEISIKIYGGEYAGLARAEFEFEDEDSARKFEPPEWVGMEITETDLGRDSRLVQLDRVEMMKLLEDTQKN